MARFPVKQVERAARDHMRLAVGHGLMSTYHKEHAEKLGPKHPDHAAHKEGAKNHIRKMGEHLSAGEQLMHVAGRTMWGRGNSEQVMKGEMNTIAKHPKGVHAGIRARHSQISKRIPYALTIEGGSKKSGHETTAAELSKPFAHEHHVLAHVHHILSDHHAALADKAHAKQAPLSKPGAEVRKHDSLASQHRARGLEHAAKAGRGFDDDKTRMHLEHFLGHNPIHGMKNPTKAHAVIAHYSKKIGGHDVHAAVKANGAAAKKHYMLSHAHSRLARHASFTGDISGHLEHTDSAIKHRKAGDKLLPEKSREAHFRKASGSLNHAVGRKLAQYAGPLREFVAKHDK